MQDNVHMYLNYTLGICRYLEVNRKTYKCVLFTEHLQVQKNNLSYSKYVCHLLNTSVISKDWERYKFENSQFVNNSIIFSKKTSNTMYTNTKSAARVGCGEVRGAACTAETDFRQECADDRRATTTNPTPSIGCATHFTKLCEVHVDFYFY